MTLAQAGLRLMADNVAVLKWPLLSFCRLCRLWCCREDLLAELSPAQYKTDCRVFTQSSIALGVVASWTSAEGGALCFSGQRHCLGYLEIDLDSSEALDYLHTCPHSVREPEP